MDLKVRNTLLVALIAIAIGCCTWASDAHAGKGGTVSNTSLGGGLKPGATPTGGDPDIGDNKWPTPPRRMFIWLDDEGVGNSLPVRFRFVMAAIAVRLGALR